MQAYEHAALPRSKRFEIKSRLGEGGAGVVYSAWDRDRRVLVALKMLRKPTPEMLLLLKKEFRGAQDVTHPNLVKLGELFEEDGQWFFTMELVDGVDLLSYVRPRKAGSDATSFDEARLRGALAQLAVGLSALHGTSKVHRDVKPSNVLVTREGRAVILDFGVMSDLKRVVNRERGGEGIVGTVAYMAPEQAVAEEASPAADWYAFGAVLYQCLTGRLPFSGSTREIIESKLNAVPPPPSSLGISVPADLEELCMQLLEPDPERRPGEGEVLAVFRRSEMVVAAQADVFVGRRREMDVLKEALAEVRSGTGVTLVVRGESGVGKSALVREFIDRARAQDASLLVFPGRCYERESVPYKAVDDVVDRLSAFLRDLDDEEAAALMPPHVRLLCDAFPVLRQVNRFRGTDYGTEAELVPREKRSRVFSALRVLLTRVAERWPTVIVVDDIQWADDDSLALLGALLAPPGPPLLFVLTERTVTQQAVRRRYDEGLPKATRYLDIERLPPDEASELAVCLAGAAANDAEFVKAVAREAQGHPMFIDALVRRGVASAAGTVVRLDDVVYARVERLPPLARRVVEVLAVAGLPLPQDVAASAVSMNMGELFDIVGSLRIENLVRTQGTNAKDVIACYHDRVTEAVAARIPKETKSDWHGRLALAFESLGGADSEALAIHWERAGKTQRAATYAARAGDEAAQALAFERAARLYRRALELGTEGEALGSSGIEATRLDLLLKLADALMNGGHLAEAAAVMLEAAPHADATTAVDLRRRAAECLLCSGHYDQGIDLIRAVLTAADLKYPESTLLLIVMFIFTKMLTSIRLAKYRERPPRKVPAAEQLRADSAWSAGNGLGMTDNLRGVYFKARYALMVEDFGDPAQLSRALAWEAMATGGPNHAHSERTLKHLEALVERNPAPVTRAWLRAAEGGLAYFWGNWHKAVEPLRESEALFRDRVPGSMFEMSSLRLMLYRSFAYRGFLRELAEHVEPVHKEAKERRDLYALNLVHTAARTPLGLADDDPTAVRAVLDEAARVLPAKGVLVQHYLYYLAMGQVELYEGDASTTLERTRAKERVFKAAQLLRVALIRIQVREQWARAALLRSFQAGTDEQSLQAEAAKQAAFLAREQDSWAQGLAALLRGCIALAKGDRDGGREELAKAIEVCDAHGLAVYAAAARHRLGEVLGGEEGAKLRVEAAQWLSGRGFKNVEKTLQLHVPVRKP